jgi:flavin-dependent dehydrogenase
MIRESHVCETRAIRIVDLKVDLVVVGGGMAGVCTSITAARAGIRGLVGSRQACPRRECFKRSEIVDIRGYLAYGE